MKFCVIIPDGMADLPVSRLGGKTPLQSARKPNMDRAAREGLLGQVRTIPPRMTPGSDTAIMSVVGYDPRKYHPGRGPLEAADMGVEMGEKDFAFRCNFITTDGKTLLDFTAGHITTKEADLLIRALNEHLGGPEVAFYTGASYRNLMLYKGNEPLKLEVLPPHDIVGTSIRDNLPKGQGSQVIADLMMRSADVLREHEVNRVRRDLHQNTADMIWLWGQGRRANMQPFLERYGCKGAAISAVNLVRGIAKLIGWDVIRVPGATGYTDTDYGAKGRYAVDALASYDLVLVHIEAPDEASHEGDIAAKIHAIERVDQEIVGPVMAASRDYPELRVLILPDHVTSVDKRLHMRGLVPFAIWGRGVKARSGLSFTEVTASETDAVCEDGHELMGMLIHG